MLEQGRDLTDVVVQLAAVSRAVDKGGFSVVPSGLRQCLSEEHADLDVAQIEHLLLTLTAPSDGDCP